MLVVCIAPIRGSLDANASTSWACLRLATGAGWACARMCLSRKGRWAAVMRSHLQNKGPSAFRLCSDGVAAFFWLRDIINKKAFYCLSLCYSYVERRRNSSKVMKVEKARGLVFEVFILTHLVRLCFASIGFTYNMCFLSCQEWWWEWFILERRGHDSHYGVGRWLFLREKCLHFRKHYTFVCVSFRARF